MVGLRSGALGLVLSVTFGLEAMRPPSMAFAVPGDISTIAGSPGEGPALAVGQRPFALATHGTVVYVVDVDRAVVRALDRATGNERVVAGSGSTAFGGDGGPATQAQLDTPRGVAVDVAGDIYIADTFNNRVRKVTVATGTIATIAGTGTPGYGGDDGPSATLARLSRPTGVAVDTSGFVYVADRDNNRVRRIDQRLDTITTVAGTGTAGFLGDGGPAKLAQLNAPWGVAIDEAHNVYVSDTNNNRVRRIDPTGVITTVAGSGVARFGGDGGPATLGLLNQPIGLAVSAGKLYIADVGNARVRVVSGNLIGTLAGTGTPGFAGDGGPATAAELNGPWGVAVDAAGVRYVADFENNRVRAIDSGGVITTVAGNGTAGFGGDGGPAIKAQFSIPGPTSLTLDAAGNIFLADNESNRVREITLDGNVTTVAGTGEAAFGGDGGPATAAPLNVPVALTFDAAGNLFIADRLNGRIREVRPPGVILTVASGFTLPSAVVFDTAGAMYVAEAFGHRVRRVDADGTLTTVAGTGASGPGGDGGPATAAQLNVPIGLAFDATGLLYIADRDNNRVRRIEADGTITTVAGDGSAAFGGDGGPATAAQLFGPWGLTFDPDGNLYIADHENNRVRRVDPSGVITTFAGQGAPGFAGDGGPATQALLSIPTGVAIDADGNVLIADKGNGRVRRVAGPRDVTPPGGGGGGGTPPGHCAASADGQDGCALSCSPDSGQVCIPGGQQRSTDCLLEWLPDALVQLNTRTGLPQGRLICTDGDPACDHDAKASACTFRLSLCFNNVDSRLTGCAPAQLTRFALSLSHSRKQRASVLATTRALLAAVQTLATSRLVGHGVLFDPALALSNRCTPKIDVVVPVGKKGTGTVKLTASVLRRGGKDKDQLSLVCLAPR